MLEALDIMRTDTSVVSLVLENRHADDVMMAGLADILQGNSTLRLLSLACSRVTLPGVELLMNAGCFAHLGTLHLHGNSLGDVGAARIVSSLQGNDWPSLQHLR